MEAPKEKLNFYEAFTVGNCHVYYVKKDDK